MKIQIRVKNVYGVVKIYPVGIDAELLAQLAGTKTLTENSIRIIKSLGYEIERVM